MSMSHNITAVTFDEDSKEYKALSMRRQADREGRVVVRCPAIVERRLGENGSGRSVVPLECSWGSAPAWPWEPLSMWIARTRPMTCWTR